MYINILAAEEAFCYRTLNVSIGDKRSQSQRSFTNDFSLFKLQFSKLYKSLVESIFLFEKKYIYKYKNNPLIMNRHKRNCPSTFFPERGLGRVRHIYYYMALSVERQGEWSLRERAKKKRFFLSLLSSFFYEPLPFSVFHYYERSRTTPTRNKNVLFTFVLYQKQFCFSY